MKNNYLYNWVVIVFMMLQMLAFTSCSDDDDNSGWPTETDKTEIFIERFSTLVTNLTALRDGATYCWTNLPTTLTLNPSIGWNNICSNTRVR